MSSRRKKLLVYIPTHTDFKQAIEQSRKIKSWAFPAELEIKTVISVNGVELSAKEMLQIEDSCDEFIFYREILGGDTNINLGYLRALSDDADFYWVLSANDDLMDTAIKYIMRELIELKTDVLIIGNSNTQLTGVLDNVFLGDGTRLPIGLISSVIYKTEKFKNSFASALKFAWTGWGQLSVIQNAIFEHGSLSYQIINEKNIYDRSSKIAISEQWEKNKSYYRHSFFGYPLLASLLFENDKQLKNEIIRNWLTSNWYKIRFFKEGTYNSNVISARDVFWTGPLSKNSILFSGLFSPILYFCGNLRLIYRLRRFTIFQKIKVRFVQKKISSKS
jgi:hypothetical protein